MGAGSRTVGNKNVLEPIFEFFTPVERLRVFTPLGIRFWDPARDIQVTEDQKLRSSSQPLQRW
jgi:hypothetical protein